MSISIVLVDDHCMVRQGLRALLERQPDLRIVGEAGDGRTAIEVVTALEPAVVVMDIGMPDLNGIEATRRLTARLPDVKVLALSMHADREYVRDILRAGAVGYLLKESAYEELVTAIRQILAGQIFVGQKIASLVMHDYVSQLAQAQARKTERLSEREREVWQLLVEGQTSARIAEHLHIGVRTVETHRKNLMEKLEVDNLADLVKLAIKEGVTSLDA